MVALESHFVAEVVENIGLGAMEEHIRSGWLARTRRAGHGDFEVREDGIRTVEDRGDRLERRLQIAPGIVFNKRLADNRQSDGGALVVFPLGAVTAAKE